MAERSCRVTSRVSVVRLALPAAAGVLAVLALPDLAARLGLHLAPEAWAGAVLGFTRLLIAAQRPFRPLAQRVFTTVPMILIAIVVLAWMRGSIGAASILMLFLSVAVFHLAAGAVDAVLDALRGLDGGPSLPMTRSSAIGGYVGGLDLYVAAEDLAPAAPAKRGTLMAMSDHAVAEQAQSGSGSRLDGGPADDWLDLERLPSDWLAGSGALQEAMLPAAARRTFDILAAGGLLLLTLPLMVLTAIAIRLETRGPIFYRQERVGQGGRVFTLFKFRSMTVDAEANGTPVWAVPQDPRVTRVGRFTRLTRIDEIPQVLNVLRGDMAFIGPRPERPLFVAQLERAIPHYADRAVVKPGITGWAQVRYRYGASVEDARMKLGYDLYYIRNRSLALDIRILAETVRVVLLQEGAR